MKSNKSKSAMTALVIAAMLCTAAMPVKAAESQWVNSNGTWSYVNEDGSKATGWIKEDGCWYAFDADGAMRTGWVASNEHWYFMGESGVMQSDAWVEDNGAKYYIKGTGVMAKDYVKDGYELTSDGKAIPLGESGSVVVTDPAELEGKVIEGNLYVDVTTAKELELKGVTVKGKLVVLGDNKTAGKVTLTDSTVETINTQSRNAEVVLSGKTEVKNVVIEETAKVTPDKNYKGEVESIEVQSTTKGEVVIEVPAENVSTRTYATVDVQAPVGNLEVKTDTQVKVNADVKNVTVTETAKDTTVEVAKGSTVGTITADAPVKIDGKGTVEKVEANVDGVEAGQDTTIKDVETGKDVTEAPDVTKPDKGGSSGGSGGGGSTPTPTIVTREVNNADDLLKAVADMTVDKIILYKDLELTENIKLERNHNLILDMNGHTITSDRAAEKGNNHLFNILGNMEITGNGKVEISSDLKVFMVNPYASLVIRNGSYETTTYFVNNYGKLTIDNATAKAKYGIAVWGNISNTTINNIDLDCTDAGVIANGLTKNAGYKIDINGGKFTCDDVAIYLPSYGEVTIDNAEIVGKIAGIEIRSGELIINNSKVTANVEAGSELDWNNGATGAFKGAIIAGKPSGVTADGYAGNLNVSINNTEIINDQGDAVAVDSRYSSAADKVTVNIDSSCTITGKVIKVDDTGKTAWGKDDDAYFYESTLFVDNIAAAIENINASFNGGTISHEGNNFIVSLNNNDITKISGTGFMNAAMYLQNCYFYNYVDSNKKDQVANHLKVTIAGEEVNLKTADKASIIALLKKRGIINEEGTINSNPITVTFTHKSIPNSEKTYIITFNVVAPEIVLLSNDTPLEIEENQEKEENNETPIDDENELSGEEESLDQNTGVETNPSEE